MGSSKTEMFSATENQIAEWAKAIAHPARVAILNYLAQSKTCICGDLVNEIGLAQPTISQHLKALKQIGLIQGTIEGTKVCYCINKANWKTMQQQLGAFISETIVTKENTCC